MFYAGQSIPTVDQGIWRPANLGNYVWIDDNHDGLQNELSNRGVNGVTVRLYTSSGTFISTTTTANDAISNPGYYTFTNLISGTYYVQFDTAHAACRLCTHHAWGNRQY